MTDLLTPDVVKRDVNRALARRGGSHTTSLSELAKFVRVSSLGSCGRQTVLKARYPRLVTDIDPESSLAMLQGDWAEAGMRALLLEAGFLFRDGQRELSFFYQGQEVLRGHIDGLIGLDYGILGGAWALWENKAMSAFRFKKVHNLGVAASSPEYMAQMQTYMWLLRNEGEDIEGTVFTAVAKDPSSVNMGNRGPRIPGIYVEFVPFDQEMADGYIERAVDLYQTIEDESNNWPHERNPSKDWDCSEKFCPVYGLCDPKHTIPRR